MKAIHQDDVEDDPVSSRVRMDSARIEALEAEVARLRGDLNRYDRQICAAEHGHTVNEVLANYRRIRRDAQDRRAREGGNNA